MDRKRRYVHALFIYFNLWNKAAAPMWRLGFNQEVREGVQRFSHSPSQHERECAEGAESTRSSGTDGRAQE